MDQNQNTPPGTPVPPQNPIPQFNAGAIVPPTKPGNEGAVARTKTVHTLWWIGGGIVAGIIITLVVLLVLAINKYGSVAQTVQSFQDSLQSKNPAVASVTQKVVSALPIKTKTPKESFVSAVTAEGVDEKKGTPIGQTNSFKNTTEKYYLVVKVSDAPKMNVKTAWYQNEVKVQEFSLPDIANSAVVTFYLDVSGSTPLARVGDYKAVLTFNDEPITEVPFHVTAQ